MRRWVGQGFPGLARPKTVLLPGTVEGLASGFGMSPGVSPPLWPCPIPLPGQRAGRNRGATFINLLPLPSHQQEILSALQAPRTRYVHWVLPARPGLRIADRASLIVDQFSAIPQARRAECIISAAMAATKTAISLARALMPVEPRALASKSEALKQA